MRVACVLSFFCLFAPAAHADLAYRRAAGEWSLLYVDGEMLRLSLCDRSANLPSRATCRERQGTNTADRTLALLSIQEADDLPQLEQDWRDALAGVALIETRVRELLASEPPPDESATQWADIEALQRQGAAIAARRAQWLDQVTRIRAQMAQGDDSPDLAATLSNAQRQLAAVEREAAALRAEVAEATAAYVTHLSDITERRYRDLTAMYDQQVAAADAARQAVASKLDHLVLVSDAIARIREQGFVWTVEIAHSMHAVARHTAETLAAMNEIGAYTFSRPTFRETLYESGRVRWLRCEVTFIPDPNDITCEIKLTHTKPDGQTRARLFTPQEVHAALGSPDGPTQWIAPLDDPFFAQSLRGTLEIYSKCTDYEGDTMSPYLEGCYLILRN